MCAYTVQFVFQSIVIMISVVCFTSFLFGNWPLKWDEKSKQFKINYCYIFTSLFVLSNFFHLLYMMSENVIADETVNINPQYLILCVLYSINCILTINRWTTAGHTRRFANELLATCGRTVESGRCLRVFWFQTACAAAFSALLHCKYATYTDMSHATVAASVTVPMGCCQFAGITMECLYTAAGRALADGFAAVNGRAAAAAPDDAAALARLSAAHCRLTRLARLYNDEYGAPMFLTTVALLLAQIFVVNDIASVLLSEGTVLESYARYAYALETFTLAWYWYRFWWICHRADGLTAQVHLTAKIMLQKDINSFPDNTRKLAFDFLNQLLHRHVKISAWGFYDVNKELLFMILGYQFGLSLICTQFSTSSIHLPNNRTINQ